MHASPTVSLAKVAARPSRRDGTVDGMRVPVAWLPVGRLALFGLLPAVVILGALSPLAAGWTIAGLSSGEAWAATPALVVAFLMIFAAYRPMLSTPVLNRRRTRRVDPMHSITGNLAACSPVLVPLGVPFCAHGDLGLTLAMAIGYAVCLVGMLELRRRTRLPDRHGPLRWYDEAIEGYLFRWDALAFGVTVLIGVTLLVAVDESWLEAVGFFGACFGLVAAAPYFPSILDRLSDADPAAPRGTDWAMGLAGLLLLVPFWEGISDPLVNVAVGIACSVLFVLIVELLRTRTLAVHVDRAVSDGHAAQLAASYGLGPAASG